MAGNYHSEKKNSSRTLFITSTSTGLLFYNPDFWKRGLRCRKGVGQRPPRRRLRSVSLALSRLGTLSRPPCARASARGYKISACDPFLSFPARFGKLFKFKFRSKPFRCRTLRLAGAQRVFGCAFFGQAILVFPISLPDVVRERTDK